MFQKRSRGIAPLDVALILALIAGAWFLRPYFSVIIFAAISAYIFNPLYRRLNKKFKAGSAASLTLLGAFGVFIIPLAILVVVTIFQIRDLLGSLDLSSAGLGQLGEKTLVWVNDIIDGIPGVSQISTNDVQSAIQKAVSTASSAFLGILTSSVGGISGFLTSLVLYIYVFLNMLIHQNRLLGIIKKINPLGEEHSREYLDKMGLMTGAMVRGQFIIAIAQGIIAALLLYIAGFREAFFFMLLVLTVLSIIPLGNGIVTIPAGIIMILTGNIWGGIFVLLGHFVLVVNIDNVLRPRLVNKEASLNSALVLLGVFSGIAMFGFLGIIIGPVIMIIITTTIDMYLRQAKS